MCCAKAGRAVSRRKAPGAATRGHRLCNIAGGERGAGDKAHQGAEARHSCRAREVEAGNARFEASGEDRRPAAASDRSAKFGGENAQLRYVDLVASREENMIEEEDTAIELHSDLVAADLRAEDRAPRIHADIGSKPLNRRIAIGVPRAR